MHRGHEQSFHRAAVVLYIVLYMVLYNIVVPDSMTRRQE